eukprot:4363635-Prymnesium_polylepis.1
MHTARACRHRSARVRRRLAQGACCEPGYRSAVSIEMAHQAVDELHARATHAAGRSSSSRHASQNRSAAVATAADPLRRVRTGPSRAQCRLRARSKRAAPASPRRDRRSLKPAQPASPDPS